MKFRPLALGGMIAALYAALTVLLAPLSYGPVQFRFSEGLTLLPYFLPEAIPGLTVGCLIANLFGGYGAIDGIVGSGATLLAGVLSYRMPHLGLAALPPILVNMLLIGGMLHVLIGVPLVATCFYVGLGEAGACYLVGFPLMRSLEKRGILRRGVGRGVR